MDIKNLRDRAVALRDKEMETARLRYELTCNILEVFGHFGKTKAGEPINGRNLLATVSPSSNREGPRPHTVLRTERASSSAILITPANAAREAVDVLPEPFTMPDVAREIKKRYPNKPRLSDKSYLSATLAKLAEQGEIVRLPSRGKLSLYRRAAG